MGNKQFGMDNRLGTSFCAYISQHPLKNQYVHFVYEKFTQEIVFGYKFCVGFLIKFGFGIFFLD